MVTRNPGSRRGPWRNDAAVMPRNPRARTLAAARPAVVAALLAHGITAPASEPWASPSDSDGSTATSTHTYRCGERVVTVDVAATTLELAIDGERLVLAHVPAASGAKYRDVHGNLFWSHGERALLELHGDAYPECTRTDCGGARCGDGPRASLGGVPWVVEDIGGRGIVDRSRVTLAFDGAGRVSGHASCNRFTASYTRDDDMLTIGPAAATRMACPPALMNQERAFLDALERVRRFAIDASGALVLIGTGSDDRLVLARRP